MDCGARVDGAAGGREAAFTHGMTTANKITILRILLVPFFIVQVLYYEAGGDEWNRLLALLSDRKSVV